MQGVAYNEAMRMMDLGRKNRKLSYRPCSYFGWNGHCKMGDDCEHFHQTGVIEHDRDVTRGNTDPHPASSSGKGRGKGKQDKGKPKGWY